MNQPPLPHPAGCSCPLCVPNTLPAVPGCGCGWCQAIRNRTPYAPGGVVPAPPAASQPPSWIAQPRRPRTPGLSRGMNGFDGSRLIAAKGPLGYRWWTLQAPPVHLSPGEPGVAKAWNPPLLRGIKDFWYPGINQATCLPGTLAQHSPAEIPHEDCGCGYWAYWQIQEHDMGRRGYLPVVGVIRGSGDVLMGPLGFRAAKAEIVALFLPFHLDLKMPLPPPPLPDYQRRALPGSSQVMTHRRFTGRVINIGGSYVPAPFRSEPPPAAPPPPSAEEIAEAQERAEAWMAVIADRLQLMYPGAEVCHDLGYMLKEYPVTDEYAAQAGQQQEPATETPCPRCAAIVPVSDIHRHLQACFGF